MDKEQELAGLAAQLLTVEAKLTTLNAERAKLALERNEIRTRIVELRHGVRVGSLIERYPLAKQTDAGKKYRVTFVDTRSIYNDCDVPVWKPWLQAALIKKDGHPAKVSVPLYANWRVLEF